ncbi:MAG TPA: MBL fold metallo-hydrolase [Anaeromyxobacteraceae bacterium]|nr:MBL fold metallo-hydrolase [Anaeromyxobacteraceae bacterium]
MGLSFIPLGVGDAFSARHYTSCVAIEAEGRWLLVDCPHPIRKVLREGSPAGAPLDLASFDAVVLTHLHSDHSSGVEGLGFYMRYVLGRRPTLAAHPRVSARLWERLAPGMDEDDHARPQGLADYFDLTHLDDARPVRIGPFEIACRRTRHHVPTYALRVTAGGRTLGISSDTPFDPSLIDWLSTSDLVVHETGDGIHTSYEKLAALPEPLRRKLRLIHFSDEFVPANGAIEPLVQGRLYSL